jgi:hypothetical protein
MPKRFLRTPDAGSRYGSWLEYRDIPKPGVDVRIASVTEQDLREISRGTRSSSVPFPLAESAKDDRQVVGGHRYKLHPLQFISTCLGGDRLERSHAP